MEDKIEVGEYVRDKALKEQIHYKEAEINNKDILKHWRKK